MKENYNRNVLLKCIVCGDTDLDYVENKSSVSVIDVVKNILVDMMNW